MFYNIAEEYDIMSKSKNICTINDNWSNTGLRITKEMLEEIKMALEDKIGISRNTFILQAIREKLDRELDERR